MKTGNTKLGFIDVKREYTGQRIDNFLFTRFKGVPKSFIYRVLRKGSIRVNKKRIKPIYKLQERDRIRIPPMRIAEHKKIFYLPKICKETSLTHSILYEDDYLIILNKLSGIAVHGGSGVSFGIIEGLRLLRPKECFFGLVHRLDRHTSGILLVAKKRSVLRLMNEQLYKKEVKKYYLALVMGEWPSHLKLVHAPLQKKNLQNGERKVYINAQGKPSETRFQVKENFGIATLLQISPITGRTHQIRVHTSHSGHPIAGDDKYGDSLFNLKLSSCTGLSRLFLHAVAIKFKHPHTGKKIYINAPLDSVLKDCLSKLRQQYYHKHDF